MKSKLVLAVALAAALASLAGGCGGGGDSTSTRAGGEAAAAEGPGANTNLKVAPKVIVPDGPAPKKPEQTEIVEGDGAEAKSGDQVTVQYVGVGYDSEKEFDASWGRHEPFTFSLGAGEVIPGWDQGIVGMKVGGRRELVIPASLAYGSAGVPPAIGPNETLIFVVDLLKVS